MYHKVAWFSVGTDGGLGMTPMATLDGDHERERSSTKVLGSVRVDFSVSETAVSSKTT